MNKLNWRKNKGIKLNNNISLNSSLISLIIDEIKINQILKYELSKIRNFHSYEQFLKKNLIQKL